MTPAILNGHSEAQNDTLVLSFKEWERVKLGSKHLTSKAAEQEELNQQLEERRKKSNLISQNWPNKIADLRKKQIEAHKTREEKREQERQQLDAEEEQFQKRRRREIIENAKRLLYFQTERIRRLHGALLLTQVLKERDLQIEVNKRKAHLLDDIEDRYLENIRRQYEQDAREKRAREEKDRKAKQMLAAELVNQMARKEQQEKEWKEDILKTRQELKEQDEQYVEELLLEWLDKDDRRRRLLQEQYQQQVEAKKIKELSQLKQLEEVRRSELYAEAKRKLQNIRKERDRHEFAQKQERLQKMRDKLGDQLAQKTQNEEEKYRKEVAEKEERARVEEERKRLARSRALQECLTHSKLKMEVNQKQAAVAQKEATLEMERMLDDYRLLQREVQDRQERVFNKQRTHKLSLAQQISEKREKEVQEKSKEMTKEMQLYKDLAMEEDFFHDYAAQILDGAKEKGYNALPLAAEPGIGFGRGPIYEERAGIRPSYQASDSSGAPLQHIFPKIRVKSSTSQRLGMQQ